MIKLTIGKAVEQVEGAICNFCSEKKACLRGGLPIFGEKVTTDVAKVIDDYDFKFVGFFSPRRLRVIKGDWQYAEVVKERHTVAIDTADICADCVKQLAKLL